MNKKNKIVLDIALVVAAVVILAFLLNSPEETTQRVPFDKTHSEYYEIYKTEGKKAAGKHCETCHNEENVPFPEDHPPKYRCLFCHKMEEEGLE
ncbi:MAG TPA: cytochrome c [Desulfuromonadales bacterium]|nr:cytochrome c [Desulfuromonadales bacterium]